VASRAGTGERYAHQVGALWSGLAGTLSRLEALAVEPDRLDDDKQLDLLRRLQYALHSASEHAFGLTPPPGTEQAHAELAAALVSARDATARIIETVEDWGVDAAEPLVYEWRGALFRVRLARLQFVGSPNLAPASEAAPLDLRAPLTALALVLGGSALFVAGALMELWPVWVVGMLVVTSSVLAFRR
jgi:hypothetical protein